MTALIVQPTQASLFKREAPTIKLRPEQEAFKSQIWEQVFDKRERRVLAVAPCGFGKTVVAASMVKDLTDQGKSVLFLVHAKCLVEQTIESFAKYHIWAGAIAGGLKETRSKPVQVAMLQTLARNRNISWFRPDYVIADECHETLWSKWSLDKFPRLRDGVEVTSLLTFDQELGVLGLAAQRNPSFEEVRSAYKLMAEKHHPDKGGDKETMQAINGAYQTLREYRSLFNGDRNTAPVLIGLTATPWRLSKKQSMGDLFKVQVLGPTPGDMVKLGAATDYTQGLVPFVYWSIPGAEIKSVRVTAGRDFTEQELREIGEAFSVPEIIQCAVDNYKSKAMGRLFICLPTTIHHAQLLHRAFERSGVKTALITGETPNKQRKQIYQEIRDNYLTGVISVGCLCLDDQTEILTKQGWVPMGKMTFDHDVANWDSGRVFFGKPHDIVVRDRKQEEKMVVFKSRSIDLRVTENHDILVTDQFNAPKNRFKKVKAIECVGKQAGLPVCGVAQPETIHIPLAGAISEKESSRRVSANAFNYRKHHGMSHTDSIAEAKKRIELRTAVKHKSPHELTLSECRLIGFWIGDGSVAKGKSGSTQYFVAQSTVYPKINEWIENTLKESGIHFTKYLSNGSGNSAPYYRYHFSLGTGFGSQSRTGVFPITPYLTKSENNLFWGLNEAQFDALIEGLWKADGDHRCGTLKENYQAIISGTELDLLDQLQAIAVCRGYKSMLTGGPVKTRPNSKPYYRLRLKKQSWTNVGGGQQKQYPYIEEGFKKEKVWCVSVESQNIIVRRNGCVAVVGNSIGFDLPEISCVIDCCPTMSKSKFVQGAGRGQRIAPWIAKTDCIYLDQAGNVKRHGMIEDIAYGQLYDSIEIEPGESPVKECPNCGHITQTFNMTCPACGYEFPAKKKEVAVGDMVLLIRENEQDLFNAFQDLLRRAFLGNYKPLWAAHQVNQLYRKHPTVANTKSGTWYPKKEWYYRAIFKDPSAEDVQTYRRYLQAATAKDPQPKAEWWFTKFIESEFGKAWQSLPSRPQQVKPAQQQRIFPEDF